MIDNDATTDRERLSESERETPGSASTSPAGAWGDGSKNGDATPSEPNSLSSEYEPNDSRNVTGAASTPDGRWSGADNNGQKSGEYEPRDSRNVTGTASTEDGRWTNDDAEKLAPGDN